MTATARIAVVPEATPVGPLPAEAVRKLSKILQTIAQSKIFRDFFSSKRSEGSKKRTKRIRLKSRRSFYTALYGDIRVKLYSI